MARETGRPWFRSSRNAWFVQIDGKQVNLGSDEKKAKIRFHDLMIEREKNALVKNSTKPENKPVVGLFDLFLEWNEKHRDRKTHHFYLDRIQSFARHLLRVYPGSYAAFFMGLGV